MSKRYKIVRNKPRISAGEIDRYKNFNKLLDNYGQLHGFKGGTKPLYRDKRLQGLVILLGIVFLTLWLTDEKQEKRPEQVQKDTVTLSPTHRSR